MFNFENFFMFNVNFIVIFMLYKNLKIFLRILFVIKQCMLIILYINNREVYEVEN